MIKPLSSVSLQDCVHAPCPVGWHLLPLHPVLRWGRQSGPRMVSAWPSRCMLGKRCSSQTSRTLSVTVLRGSCINLSALSSSLPQQGRSYSGEDKREHYYRLPHIWWELTADVGSELHHAWKCKTFWGVYCNIESDLRIEGCFFCSNALDCFFGGGF